MSDTDTTIPRRPSLARWRNWALLLLPLLVIAATAVISPDGWRDPLVRCLGLAWSAVCLALAHSGRTALFDYVRAGEAWRKALEHPIGAGLAFLGICLLTAALFLGTASLAHAQDVRTYVPAAAQRLAPMVVQEIDGHWPGIPHRSYVGSLIEQESCISLTHSRCWNSTARLKTAREEGAGLGQLTRAWSADGRLRFDALAEVRAMAPAELGELTWSTVYQRADLGVRAVLIKLRACDTRLQQLAELPADVRMAFCDAEYNGGRAGLDSDRRLCGLTKGCNPALWFGNVERTSSKSRTAWQGYGKSAFDINREHVRMAVVVRRPKYIPYLGA